MYLQGCMFRFTNVDVPVEIRLNSSWHPLGVHPSTFNIEGIEKQIIKKFFFNLFVAIEISQGLCCVQKRKKHGCK